MADDRTNAGRQDRTRINVNEDYEVRYWSHRFQVEPDQIRVAVSAVGTYAVDVEHYLKEKRHG